MEHLKINSKRFILTLAVIIVVGCQDVLGQYQSEKDATIPLENFYIRRKGHGLLRPWLSKLHLSFSTGYGSTSFKHKLDGFGIAQDTDSIPKIFSISNPGSAIGKWVEDINPAYPATPAAFIVSSDSSDIGFKSPTLTIPLKGTVHIEFNRYRIGGGYSYDYTRAGEFKPLAFGDSISGFTLAQPSFFMKHYFGMIGAMVYRYDAYALVVDANIGGYKLGRQFNTSLIQKGIYFNLGVTVEREFSEYFRVFVRPSFEIRGYKIAVPESGASLSHRMNTVYFNVGATYRLPELRRCYNKSCKAQLNHVHGNREYRSRVHPFYKKQNPHYGENYPVLMRYKGRNKNKMNPY